MLSTERLLEGLKNPGLATRHLLRQSASRIEPLVPIGTNIYDREWDVLVVLDACRYDLFEEFAPEHDVWKHFDSVDSIHSVASTTAVWLPRTFDEAPEDEVADTHYVTCTAYTDKLLDDGDFHQVDHVWKYAKDPETGHPRPEAVTDAAIDAVRSTEASRVVVHYVQPHAPFLHCLGKYDSVAAESGAGATQAVWRGLREGRFDRDEVWQDYGQNLLRGLDEVQTLVENTDADLVITSDHGNALGEMRMYGHPRYAAIPAVRKVPWVRVDCQGGGDYEVRGREAMTTGSEESTISENLRALGYRQ